MDEKMIIAVNASTHKDGSGETILKAVVEGARENGKEVRIFNLNEFGPLRECQNCGSCRRAGIAFSTIRSPRSWTRSATARV